MLLVSRSLNLFFVHNNLICCPVTAFLFISVFQLHYSIDRMSVLIGFITMAIDFALLFRVRSAMNALNVPYNSRCGGGESIANRFDG